MREKNGGINFKLWNPGNQSDMGPRFPSGWAKQHESVVVQHGK